MNAILDRIEDALETRLAALPRDLGLEASPGLVSAIRLVGRALADGAPCIDLAAFAGRVPDGESGPACPALGPWRSELAASAFVGAPGSFRPLVLDGDRLYFARYWMYERDVAAALAERARRTIAVDAPASLGRDLDALFARNAAFEEPDLQKQAAFVAATRGLCVISGGPGTGKTSTVLRLLVALQAQHADAPLTIRLAAPTGKAAARMKDAVRRAKDEVRREPACAHLVGALDTVPDDASTLHRLLGARPGSVRTRHDARRPLHADVVVVDEASMIDLALMARLVAALPCDTRLVLLGDKDQLESVEAGRVFADLCSGAPALAASVVALVRSHRFGHDTPIGRLARAVNAGDADAALAVLHEGHESAVARLGRIEPVELDHAILRGYDAYVAALDDPALDLGLDDGRRHLFRAFERFRVLAALREGPAGVSGLNARIERALAARLGPDAAGRPRIVPGRHWLGQPLIVTRNDHERRLYNGDIGLVVPAAPGTAATAPGARTVQAAFPGDGDALRLFAPGALPDPEPVCAMTVHKSQGSEFDHVLLVLPPEASSVLTRSLVYTAITRARSRVEIWGPEDVLRRAIATVDVRTGGLAERMGALATT